MKPLTMDPFIHLPNGAQISVFAWRGRRDRCEHQLSRFFGENRDAARARLAELRDDPETARVQVVGKWYADGIVYQQRVNCRPNGHVELMPVQDMSTKKPLRFPDADVSSLSDDAAA